ncbi:MAG: serine/threonine protein kinase [Victivallaceae bacterium]
MIIVLRDSECRISVPPSLEKLDAKVHVFELPNRNYTGLFNDTEPAVLVVMSGEVTAIARAFAADPWKGQKRLLAVLDADQAELAIHARIAGADSVLVAPGSGKEFLHAVANEYSASQRALEAQEMVRFGTKISGRYPLLQVLGVSLRSACFLAGDPVRGRPVTIKLLRRKLLDQPNCVAEFLADAELRKQFTIPGVVNVLDCGMHDDNTPFVVNECGKMDNLYSHWRKKKPAETDLIRLGGDLVEALSGLKSRGCLHLDLKPENIFFDGRNYLLGDFGILAEIDSPRDHTGFPFWQDAGFCAPEMFRASADVTGAADIFALGMVLYTGLTGRNPSWSRSAKEIAGRRERQVLDFPDEVDPALRTLVTAMTGNSPSRRPRLPELRLLFPLFAAARQPGERPTPSDAETAGEAKALNNLESTEIYKKRRNQPPLLPLPSAFVPRGPGKFGRRTKVLAALALLLVIVAVFFRSCGGDDKTQRQGELELFTCYSGHTMPDRTLDYRNIRCRKCGDYTSPSMVCTSCGKVFGKSLWPNRPMTEAECVEFEKKLRRCPFCKSTAIRRNTLDQPAPAAPPAAPARR